MLDDDATDDAPASESGYVRLPGHLDLPALLAASVYAEADARGERWQVVVARAVAAWELARQEARRDPKPRRRRPNP